MFPYEGSLFFLGHLFFGLPLLLGFLGWTASTPFASLIPLTLDAVFDVPHTIEDQLVPLFDDVENAQLMLNVFPPRLQAVFIQRRAIGNGHANI